MPPYATANIAFAAFLLAHHAGLIGIERNGKRVAWLFQLSPEEAHRLEMEWLGSGESRFFSFYQTLKSGIREDRLRRS